VLTRQGVTAWRRALTTLTPDTRPAPTATAPPVAAAVPAPICAELINVLAAVVLAGT
jgi:hypothetical protein